MTKPFGTKIQSFLLLREVTHRSRRVGRGRRV